MKINLKNSLCWKNIMKIRKITNLLKSQHKIIKNQKINKNLESSKKLMIVSFRYYR